MFDETKFGKWKFCKDEDIRDIVGDNDTDLKIAVMADVGRCNYKEDILPKNESPIDMVRVATYLNTIPAAIDMIDNVVSKGYEATCNLMAISTAQEKDVEVALNLLAQTDVKVLYIVDSYGAMYPEQLARTIDLFMNIGAKYGKEIGIHAHNNQQMAFANTIEAVGDGVNYLDATYNMMGRGAGNCAMELLMAFLKNPKYNVYPVFRFIQTHMEKLKQEGIVWGYDLQYLMTGILNLHPRSAIQFTDSNRKDYADFYSELLEKD
jgi:4-hydroxy 2-oxovalerate aldolase